MTSNGVGSTDFAIETSGPSANVTIAGTVNGGGGGAISLGPGNDRLELQPGAVVNGLVLGGVGTDSFVLGGTGTASFDVGLIGTQHQSFELFSKEAASHWTLTGTNAGISNWAVNGGLLSVNAAMPNTAFAVNAGTLGGVGTIGAFTAFAGGTVAPGNGIGTLNVVGNVAFNAGSFYAVEVDPAGNSDKVLAGGTATLSGGTVQVLAQSGTYNLCVLHRQSRRRGHVRWCHEQFRVPDADT